MREGRRPGVFSLVASRVAGRVVFSFLLERWNHDPPPPLAMRTCVLYSHGVFVVGWSYSVHVRNVSPSRFCVVFCVYFCMF